jgi:hypothetical protein
VRQVWDEILGIGTLEPERPQPGSFRKTEYLGCYRSRAHSWLVEPDGDVLRLTFRMNDGVWPTFDPPGYELEPFHVAPVRRDRFVILDGWLSDGIVEFCRDEDGSVAWLHALGRAAKRRPENPGGPARPKLPGA